jgi:hypothetical protein
MDVLHYLGCCFKGGCAAKNSPLGMGPYGRDCIFRPCCNLGHLLAEFKGVNDKNS